jgi:hypothetical protein
VKTTATDGNALITFCNSRHLQVLPAAFFQEPSRWVVFMNSLHHQDDNTLGFGIQPRQQCGIEPIANSLAQRFRLGLSGF